MLIAITIHNRGPDAAEIHVLPQLWFRNTWTWDATAAAGDAGDRGQRAWRRSIRRWSDYVLRCDAAAPLLFCQNETNNFRLFGRDRNPPYPKDAFHDFVVGGDAAAVNPAQTGTKSAFHVVRTVPADELDVDPAAAVQRRRRRRRGPTSSASSSERRQEAELFYAELQAGHRRRRRPARPAAGVRRHDLEQAVLRHRRAALAQRRPGRTRPAGRAPPGPQRATGSTSTTPT